MVAAGADEAIPPTLRVRPREPVHRGENSGNTKVYPSWYHQVVKVGVSLPEALIAFADEEAERRGTTRSGLLAALLEQERVRLQAARYFELHGWDVGEEDDAWREYQRASAAREYGGDEW